MKFRRFVFAFLVFVLLLAALATAAAAAQKPPARPGPATATLRPVSPQAAVRCLAQAYRDMSSAQLAALLAGDYRFHFSAGDSLEGLARDRELLSARRLFGEPVEGLDPMPPISDLRVSIGGLDESPDPEHPDSLAQYRVVVARKFGLRFRMDGEEDGAVQKMEIGDLSTHVFSLVRGDVAQLVDGQPALADRWYVRRWMENIEGLAGALAGRDGNCDESAAGAPSGGVFGVRPLDAPLCPTLEVVCDLPTTEPATLEVFDLQGRRVARQVVRPASPGPVRIAAGSGNRFAPGAYWLRLTQGRRPASRRLVMVAR